MAAETGALPSTADPPAGRDGTPGTGFPWPWLINPWLSGVTADRADLRDPARFAGDLAHFLNALRRIDATDAPPPGHENFHRGGDLDVYADDVAACLVDLDAPTARRVEAVWQVALDAREDAHPVWVHGDVAARNLLVEDGRLAAVIDFGQLAAGDPACDVTVAWTLFRGRSRQAFKAALAVDEDTWRRGRGWALWKALLGLRDHRPGGAQHRRAWSVLDAVLAEHGRPVGTTGASATIRGSSPIAEQPPWARPSPLADPGARGLSGANPIDLQMADARQR